VCAGSNPAGGALYILALTSRNMLVRAMCRVHRVTPRDPRFAVKIGSVVGAAWEQTRARVTAPPYCRRVSDWDAEDLESRLMPEQLRLGLVRGTCLLAIDRLLAIQLDQLDDLERDIEEDDLDPLASRDPEPPTADPERLKTILRQLTLHEILTEGDCEVVRPMWPRVCPISSSARERSMTPTSCSPLAR
jgi:hypothetical protein